MNNEHPSALRFIFQDDLYFLKNDQNFYTENRLVSINIETSQVKLNFIGGNKKKFLVVVDYPGNEFISGEHLTALQSLLKRMKFDTDDVAIFNLAKDPHVTLKKLIQFFDPNKLLLLGCRSLPSGIEEITLNVPVVFNDISMLYSFSFDEMMDNTANKKTFWEQVKQL